MNTSLSTVSMDQLLSEVMSRLGQMKATLGVAPALPTVASAPSKVTKSKAAKTVAKSKRKTNKSKSRRLARTSTKNAGPSTADRISAVLVDSAEGMKITDIMNKLVETGWTTRAKEKYYVVATALATNKNKFTRVAKGVYVLNREQAPLATQ